MYYVLCGNTAINLLFFGENFIYKDFYSLVNLFPTCGGVDFYSVIYGAMFFQHNQIGYRGGNNCCHCRNLFLWVSRQPAHLLDEIQADLLPLFPQFDNHFIVAGQFPAVQPF